jgi:hypothetical protein
VRREFLVIVLLSGACTSSCRQESGLETRSRSAVPSAGLIIHTERDEYRPVITSDAVTLTIVSTLTNSTPDTLWLHPCVQHPPYPLSVGLDHLEGNEWRPVLQSECDLMLMLEPLRLLPGLARVDTLRLIGSTHPNTVPAFKPGPLDGIYRLHYFGIYRKWHPRNPPAGAKDRIGEQLSDSLRVSNVFRISE